MPTHICFNLQGNFWGKNSHKVFFSENSDLEIDLYIVNDDPLIEGTSEVRIILFSKNRKIMDNITKKIIIPAFDKPAKLIHKYKYPLKGLKGEIVFLKTLLKFKNKLIDKNQKEFYIQNNN